MKAIVQPIHFEDYSGQQFERLAFAYILRTKDWDTIDWYGQLGSDHGRDIWGVLSNRGQDYTVCYQCANYQRLKFDKVKQDINKICSGPNHIPSKFVLIVGGKVSANMKMRIKTYAQKENSIPCVEIWSGPEFEERLRRDTPSLIRRFYDGEPFPDSVSDLFIFGFDAKEFDDDKLLAAYASCFDRPAFTTPFHQESSLPHFKKAITDTIEAIQTGVHRLRDGTVIKRFPGISEVREPKIQVKLQEIVIELQKLRASYDGFLRSGEVKPCGCGKKDCPVHFLSPNACLVMDQLRHDILNSFRSIYPAFKVRMWRSFY